jgi:hypothetical protein
MNPNPYPKGRRTRSADALANIANAPLRQLFWSAPEISVSLEEAEQRIAACLQKALTPEPVQLFDDLYENPAC